MKTLSLQVDDSLYEALIATRLPTSHPAPP
jgi:hypothetical protein